MTACRVDPIGRARRAAWLAATLGLILPCAAAAQLGPPIRLGPPGPSDSGPAGASDNDNPLLAPIARGDAPVERAPAPPLEPGAVSAVPPEPQVGPVQIAPPQIAPAQIAPAQIAPDETVQDAPARARLEALLAQLPLRIASPAARQLVVRALAGPGPSDGGVAALRAARLLAMGDVADAGAIAQRGPATDEGLQRVRLDLLLLADDVAAACTLARAQVARTPTADWQRALIYCQLRDNQNDLAELGLSMVGDGTTPEDAAFARLALAMLAGHRAASEIVREPSPLLLAMLRAAGQPLPAASLDTASPAILGSLARARATAAAQRLAAADRAEAFGALDTGALLQVYDAVSFSAREATNLPEVADTDRGPRGRVALHRLAKAAEDDNARAVALQLMWRLGRERGAYQQSVRIGIPVLARIEPAARLTSFAPDAVRAFLLMGNVDAAQRWVAVASRDDSDLLWPVLRAAGADRGAPGAERARRPFEEGIEAWRRVAAARDAGFARTRIEAVRTIVAAVDAAGDPAGRRVAGPLPADSEALSALRTAAASGRRGETALQAARILVAAPGANAIAAVVRALGTVGLVAEARAVAVEALLTAGL